MPHRCPAMGLPINVVGDGNGAGVVEKKGVVKGALVHPCWCEHQLLHQAGEWFLAD